MDQAPLKTSGCQDYVFLIKTWGGYAEFYIDFLQKRPVPLHLEWNLKAAVI